MRRRIQLSRAKGWRMPANTIKADRSTKLGNPFVVGVDGTREECVRWHVTLLAGYVNLSVRASPKDQIAHRRHVRAQRKRLKDANIACWCGLCPAHKAAGKPENVVCVACAPCHVDNLFLVKCD